VSARQAKSASERIDLWHTLATTTSTVTIDAPVAAVPPQAEDPSKELPLVSHQNALTGDFLIWTESGLYYRVNAPGAGTVLIDAGRVILDATNASPDTPPEVL